MHRNQKPITPEGIERDLRNKKVPGKKIEERLLEFERGQPERAHSFGIAMVRFLEHRIKKENEATSDRKNDRYFAELLGRYVRRFLFQKIVPSGQDALPVNIKKYWDALRKTQYIEGSSFTATLEDLTKARTFFAKQTLAGRDEEETLWDLYKAYDPDGKRAMHVGHFHTLLPKEWKKRYKIINAPYEDCKSAEEWFAKQTLEGRDEEEIFDELYEAYQKATGKIFLDPRYFYFIMPAMWKQEYPFSSDLEDLENLI
ncbi:hypothetical protein HY621_02715 [Candidatus Uhrbacteria bacterium]|nr:hypothetical protein [Candidatus Uhrbacteria bacterium]